jgi:L-2,4-diaminobutyrate decarboxylase
MAGAAQFAAFVAAEPRLELFAPPETGVVLWRPRAGEAAALAAALPAGLASTARAGDETWLRCVAANPLVDVGAVTAAVTAALDGA